MEISNFSYSVSNNIVTVSATIDGVKYNNITPKFVANKEIVNSNKIDLTYYNHNDIKYKSSTYTTPGINAIDIDWNGVIINTNPNINSTSDLIKLLSNIDVDVNLLDDGGNYWVDYDPSKN